MIQELASYIGYVASVFIVLSFLFREVRSIRITNLVGCLCFVVYGFFGSDSLLLPVIIPNAILSLVQIFYLFKDEPSKK